MGRRRSSKRDAPYEELDVDRIMSGTRRSESRRGQAWTVQPISAENAVKSYVCPGCGGTIAPGIAHIAAWRNDGILGDDADLNDRRHWHTHCWKIS